MMENLNPQDEQRSFSESTPEPAAGPADRDFGAIFSEATSMWTSNMGNLILITLIFALVCWVPIANIGFAAGYYRALLKTARGEKAEISDIFGAWDCFGQLFLYVIIIAIVSILVNLIPILGILVSIVICFFVIPGLFAIIDRGMGAIEALKWTIKAFMAGIGSWILVILVGSILGGIGAIVFGIGIIVTMPWGYLMMVLMYENQKDLDFE